MCACVAAAARRALPLPSGLQADPTARPAAAPRCGALHSLEEFDGSRRSCRAGLARHNVSRRRQPAHITARAEKQAAAAAVAAAAAAAAAAGIAEAADGMGSGLQMRGGGRGSKRTRGGSRDGHGRWTAKKRSTAQQLRLEHKRRQAMTAPVLPACEEEPSQLCCSSRAASSACPSPAEPARPAPAAAEALQLRPLLWGVPPLPLPLLPPVSLGGATCSGSWTGTAFAAAAQRPAPAEPLTPAAAAPGPGAAAAAGAPPRQASDVPWLPGGLTTGGTRPPNTAMLHHTAAALASARRRQLGVQPAAASAAGGPEVSLPQQPASASWQPALAVPLPLPPTPRGGPSTAGPAPPSTHEARPHAIQHASAAQPGGNMRQQGQASLELLAGRQSQAAPSWPPLPGTPRSVGSSWGLPGTPRSVGSSWGLQLPLALPSPKQQRAVSGGGPAELSLGWELRTTAAPLLQLHWLPLLPAPQPQPQSQRYGMATAADICRQAPSSHAGQAATPVSAVWVGRQTGGRTGRQQRAAGCRAAHPALGAPAAARRAAPPPAAAPEALALHLTPLPLPHRCRQGCMGDMLLPAQLDPWEAMLGFW